MIYVISPKNAYAAERLLQEAKIMNYDLQIVDLKTLITRKFRLPLQKGDVLYIRNPYLNQSSKYIPQIVKIAKRFKTAGGRVVDSNIIQGDLGKGKWRDYQKLEKAQLPIPKTKYIPLSDDRLQVVYRYPYILKWVYGMKAKGTFLIASKADLKRIPTSIPKKELIFQEYIEADYEYKVITIGYKALPVILRFKFNKKLGRVDFKNFDVINVSKILLPKRVEGQNFYTVGFNPLTGAGTKTVIKLSERASKTLGRELAFSQFLPLEGGGWEGVKKVIEIAQKASKTLGRELAKVDILEKSGKFYILEVNRFPGLKSFEKLTKFNVIEEFVKYLNQ